MQEVTQSGQRAMGAAAVLLGHDALAAIVPTSIGPSGANQTFPTDRTARERCGWSGDGLVTDMGPPPQPVDGVDASRLAITVRQSARSPAGLPAGHVGILRRPVRVRDAR